MVSASQSKPNMVSGNPALANTPIGTIRLLYEDYDITNPVNIVMPVQLTGLVSRVAGDPLVTGAGTLFTAEVKAGDYITYFDGFTGLSNTQVVSQVDSVISDVELLTVDGAIQPLSGAIDFVNGPCWIFEPALIPNIGTLDADPSAVSASKAGNRLYYYILTAYNWNTAAFENIASTYAIANGQNEWDLGWEDEASWKVVLDTLLTWAGWNTTITTVVPDTTLINNANQEIVVYYQTDVENYNGVATPVVKDVVFYEQTGIAVDYATQLGGIPFQQFYTYYDATDYNGINFDLAGAQIVAGFGVVAEQGLTQVRIGRQETTSNKTPSSIAFTDQDFTAGQFELFIKYSVYDGFEAIAAKELVKMGVQVSPENVDWYRKEIERLGEVEELAWPFDEESEAPIEDDPKSYDPTSENPTDYIPRNDEVDRSEEDAD